MDRSTRLRILSGVVLIAGLASALAIYIGASQPGDNPLGDPEDSKRYLHDMELYGGKANLLATEARDWVHGLWHGRRLAFTVAFLAALAAGGLRLAAIPLPPLEEDDAGAGPGAGGHDAGRRQEGSRGAP